MNLDNAIKKVLAQNVKINSYFLKYLSTLPADGNVLQFFIHLAQVGYQTNLYLLKEVENIKFEPGDELTQEMDSRLMLTDDPEPDIHPTVSKKELTDYEKDIKELSKIYHTPDHPVIEFPGEKKDNGTKSNDTPGWYDSLFGPKRSLLEPGEEITDTPKE